METRGNAAMHIPYHRDPLGPYNETVFIHIMCDYVFMSFLPSFLRFPGGSVTRIHTNQITAGGVRGP
jgi:hypothetical protein